MRLIREIEDILKSRPERMTGTLNHLVEEILTKKERLLATAAREGSPSFIFDEDNVSESKQDIMRAASAVPRSKIYYAAKSNDHDFMLSSVIASGIGIDVSSGVELRKAIKLGCEDVLFTGPAKTDEELSAAVDNADNVTVNIDSFNEYRRLTALCRARKKQVRAGIRVSTRHHGRWNKFGIPLQELCSFWKDAADDPYVKIQGIQVHMSWNKDAVLYVKVISDIAEHLKEKFTKKMVADIRFIDLGGGFLPYRRSGYYPWEEPAGQLQLVVDEYHDRESVFEDKYFITRSVPLEEYFTSIAAAVSRYLDPILKCSYFFEPGRILSHRAMHILLRVIDIKREGMAILDGGTNMVGWEKYESEYHPVVNLSHPAVTERDCSLFGSLCTPYDMWGYSYFGSTLKEGDYLVIPNQGAYTYSLSQHFIKGEPAVVALSK